MELLQTRAELERELRRLLLHCRRCNRRVHWVSGVGPEPGHWSRSPRRTARAGVLKEPRRKHSPAS
jgi:hypothetical protein